PPLPSARALPGKEWPEHRAEIDGRTEVNVLFRRQRRNCSHALLPRGPVVRPQPQIKNASSPDLFVGSKAFRSPPSGPPSICRVFVEDDRAVRRLSPPQM